MEFLKLNSEKAHQRSVKVSLVFPAYNEFKTLEASLKKTIITLNKFARSYEIIIAEDGSTDGTDRLAASFANNYSFVKHIHSEKRLGRGTALKNAFRQSSGEILVYMDLDLSTDLEHLKPLVDAVAYEGYDFATGSRMLSESNARRSSTRYIVSKTYNIVVRIVLGSKIKDHQCGFKAFRRKPLLQLLDDVRANHWFWDTEILIRACRMNFKIKEIPVSWKAGRGTKVRLIHDSLKMGWQIFTLWWQLNLR